ncbi:hypothetical protein HY486_00960 [Candidatus Woesearchaeota archaeon]|nr:hypothetical protein [Candidatus Woesearchaeota archaeon]
MLLLILALLMATTSLATPFCDNAEISVQKIEAAFCLSARINQEPRLEFALENTGWVTIPIVELIAVTNESKEVFFLEDAMTEYPWNGAQQPKGNKRTFYYSPLKLKEYMWGADFYVRPRFGKTTPECFQKTPLPQLKDCHSHQPITTIGDALKIERKQEIIIEPVEQTNIDELIQKYNKTIMNDTINYSLPTGAVTTKIANTNLSITFAFLFILALTLGFMLIGSYLKGDEEEKIRKKIVQEQKKEFDEILAQLK